MAVLSHSLPRALADLAGLEPGVGGTLGMLQVTAAGVACLAVLHEARGSP